MTTEPDNLDALSAFLGRLADKHVDMDIVFSLRVAETGVDSLKRVQPSAPTLAVAGPTQTGKSTVVNILAGGEHVETSPLAAHTQRACVLAVDGEGQGGRLPAQHLGDRSLVPQPVDSDAPPCLIWDTPDFDSNAAAVYRQEVARVCALADLLLVVVSREKYADQSVWRILEITAPLETPTILCLNKCGGDVDSQVIVQAIERRLAGNPAVQPDIPVRTLPLLDADVAASLEREAVASFRRDVLGHLARRSTPDRRAGLARLIRAGWDEWVEPVEQELACRREWRELLEAQTRAFLARYRSEYIDHSKHHDVAQKAIIGLLELLEIPALAGPISRTRRALTWPFRRLAAAVGRRAEAPVDKEVEVLDAAIEHYLLTLRGEATARRHPWWRALEAELTRLEPDMKQAFRASVEEYREAFQPRIDDLSRQLYARLQRNPATLNALRATRIGADAGGIVIAIKTGTLGLYDALFAPAIVSLTSYLTESVVGQYLKSVIAGLKREQYDTVSAIVHDTVERPLESLQPGAPQLFGISAGEMARARRGLEELER